jgi:hypothetical protein
VEGILELIVEVLRVANPASDQLAVETPRGPFVASDARDDAPAALDSSLALTYRPLSEFTLAQARPTSASRPSIEAPQPGPLSRLTDQVIHHKPVWAQFT